MARYFFVFLFWLSVVFSFACRCDSAVSGQVVVVIGDYDQRLAALHEEWVHRTWLDVNIVLVPYDFKDLVQNLRMLGKEEPIKELIFFGHGTPDGIYFSQNQSLLLRHNFLDFKRDYPDLPLYFTEGAEVKFFNCSIGQNQPLMEAVGDVFLRFFGGTVSAFNDYVLFIINSDAWGNEYVDEIRVNTYNRDVCRIAPHRSTDKDVCWNEYSYEFYTEPCKVARRAKMLGQDEFFNECSDKFSSGYNSDSCKWQRDIARAVKEMNERNKGQPLLRRIR